MISLRGSVVRVYLPPDANTLLAVADHCLASRDYVNLIVVDKQAHLQYLGLDEARQQAAGGASAWDWAGTEGDADAELVLACVGDVPTMETLRPPRYFASVPDLRFRVVNVIDLMVVPPSDVHPHGLSQERFEELFGADLEVVAAFHGYERALHQLLHGRRHPGRFHVRGFKEVGTTTTPFDMVVLNQISRYHLAREALRRSPRRSPGADELEAHCDAMLARHRTYIREHLEHARGSRLDLAGADVTIGTVLVVNAGSSSLKLRVLGADDALLGSRDVSADDDWEAALEQLLDDEPRPTPQDIAWRMVAASSRNQRWSTSS